MKKYIVFLILTGLFGFGLMGQNEKVGKELMKVIKTRASVRQFADKPIEVEKVSHMLLDAAMAAPTAMNKQPWEFIVITDPEIMKKMGKEFKNASALSTAKAVNLFVDNLAKTFPDKDIYMIDERFTSKIASQTIAQSGMKKKKRQDKGLIDAVAAVLILQDFMQMKK